MRTSLLAAVVCVMAAFTWQALVVHYQYGGNWTGLYYTGEHFTHRPPLGERLWIFPDSDGYDGQFYHYIAHDPWFQRNYSRFIDAPRLRYHRILLPALANLLAGGRDRYVDRMYIGLMLLSVLLGSWWMSRYAHLHGGSPWLGVGFLFAPSVLISIDRLTVDAMLAALCAGLVWFAESNPGWPLYVLLMAAPMVRETGLLLPGACVAALVLDRRFWRAAVFSTAVLPTAGWYWWVGRQTTPEPSRWFHEWPLQGYLHQLLHPNSYPLALPAALVVNLLDYVSLAGVALSMVWALVLLRRKTFTPVAIAIYGFAALATILPTGDFWSDPISYGRVLTPLFLLLALESLREKRPSMALPMLLVTPRICVQLAAIALRVAKAMLA
jgi:hypothetical protein